MDTKTCMGCGACKPLDDFYRKSKSRDGRSSRCKDCANEGVRQWREANKERVAQKNREWYEANKERHAASVSRWEKANREYLREVKRKWRQNNKDLVSVYNRRWRESHPHRAAENSYRWMNANKDRRAEVHRKWAKSNPERINEIARRYRANNPDKVRARNRNRKALKKSASGSFTDIDIHSIFDSQNGTCVYHGLNPKCQIDLRDGYHIDHITPLVRGGSNWPDNLQLLCPHCNMSKHDKTHEEYIEYLVSL